MSSLGEWPAIRVVNGVLWPNFHCFFFDVWSQIYTLPLISTRHAPLSRVSRRPPLPLPET